MNAPKRSETALKPCPFCGGEAISRGSDYDGYWVTCRGCMAFPFKKNTRERAIEAWNTRAERTCKRFWTGAEMICSSCAHQLNNGTANYCPNCGAKVIA